MSDALIVASKIIKPRGLRGEMKCVDFSPIPKSVFLNQKEHRIVKTSLYDGFVYLTLEGIDTVEKAESLRGVDICVRREDLELDDDEILIDDLIGYSVVDESGKVLGTVKNVSNYGQRGNASETIECDNFSFPYEDAFVLETNVKKRTLVVSNLINNLL